MTRGVLGPMQLIIYINDIDDNIVNAFSKLANYPKIDGTEDSEECYLSLQND